MNEDLSDLSAEEVFELLVAHNDRHGYSFGRSQSIEKIQQRTGRWTRDFIISEYESRTDVWEDFKKEILADLNKEAIVEIVELFEHLQEVTLTKGKTRKKPSLWSFEPTQKPVKVEVAAAHHYQRKGYQVSQSFHLVESILYRAYAKLRYSSKCDFLITRAHPESLLEINNVDGVDLRKALDQTIEENLKQFKKISMMGGPLANKDRLRFLKAVTKQERDDLLEGEFCELTVMGTTRIDELKTKLIDAHTSLPANFLSEYYVNTAIFHRYSGVPDLFIWNDSSFRFVEVKSPNDVPILNQARFYRHVLKRMNMNFNIAQIKSKAVENLA